MTMTTDPVCGMAVDERRALHWTHLGQTHYFCGSGCQKAFRRKPEKYLDPGYKPSMLGALTDWLRAVVRGGGRR